MTARKGPGFVCVTVTVLVLADAVMPTVAGHTVSAARTFEAKVVVLALVAKVPAVVLEHAFVPLVPAVVESQV